MAAHRVKLRKADLAYFRRLALDSECEIESYLIGSETSDNVTSVTEFLYPKQYEVQKPNFCQWSSDDMADAEARAKKLHKKIIGSIHSHPNYLSVMSPTDYREHKKLGWKILGICGTNTKERKTFPVFWVAESALPCKVIYTDEGE